MSTNNLPEGDSISHLAPAEWLAVIAIMGFLIMLTALSMLGSGDLEDLDLGAPHHLKPQFFEVLIQGAVTKPGSYQVPVEARIKEIVALAEPSPEADLKGIKATSKVRNGQVINVPAKEMIEIKVSGAVKGKAQTVKIPRGTRLNELEAYVAFDGKADIAKLDRKRYLRNGEEVVVPYKK